MLEIQIRNQNLTQTIDVLVMVMTLAIQQRKDVRMVIVSKHAMENLDLLCKSTLFAN